MSALSVLRTISRWRRAGGDRQRSQRWATPDRRYLMTVAGVLKVLVRLVHLCAGVGLMIGGRRFMRCRMITARACLPELTARRTIREVDSVDVRVIRPRVGRDPRREVGVHRYAAAGCAIRGRRKRHHNRTRHIWRAMMDMRRGCG